MVAVSMQRRSKVTDFESCKAAGGIILEMYPEQCRVYGASYINESQVSPGTPEPGATTNGDEYIGLSESDALAKAEEENIPARVVERDGEGLPITMDFVFGRLNFYVKDGNVYKVEVEGLASDSN